MVEQIVGDLFNTIFGGIGNFLDDKRKAQEIQRVNEQNYKMQKEFAQNSLSWKIKDGERNGIHPLSAIGASTYQATPSFVGSSQGSSMGGVTRSLGNSFKDLLSGQSELQKAQIELLKAQKDKVRSDIAKTTGQSIGGQIGQVNNDLGTESVHQALSDAKGNVNIFPTQDIIDLNSESLWRDVAYNSKTQDELRYLAGQYNYKLAKGKKNYRYVPSTISETIKNGSPFLRRVGLTEYNQYLKKLDFDKTREHKEYLKKIFNQSRGTLDRLGDVGRSLLFMKTKSREFRERLDKNYKFLYD